MVKDRRLAARNMARKGNLFNWLTFMLVLHVSVLFLSMFFTMSSSTRGFPLKICHSLFFSTLEKRECLSIFNHFVLYWWLFSLFHRCRLCWLENRRSNVRCRILGKPFFRIAKFHKNFKINRQNTTVFVSYLLGWRHVSAIVGHPHVTKIYNEEKLYSIYFYFPNGRHIDCSSLTYATHKSKTLKLQYRY